MNATCRAQNTVFPDCAVVTNLNRALSSLGRQCGTPGNDYLPSNGKGSILDPARIEYTSVVDGSAASDRNLSWMSKDDASTNL
jgi:hypothetical protein